MQTGTSCAWSIARVYLYAWPPFTVWCAGIGRIVGGAEDASWMDLVVPVIVGLVPLFFAALYVREAWTKRPSDMVMTTDAVTFEGGLHHRARVPWSKLVGVRAERLETWNLRVWADSVGDTREDPVEEAKRQARLQNPETDVELQIDVSQEGTPTPMRWVLAEGELPIEERSLTTLCAVLEHRSGTTTAAAVVPRASPHAVICTSCGSTVTPVAEPTTRCPHCSSDVAMTDDVRTRVTHALAIERTGRAISTQIADVLDQARALAVNRFFAFASVLLVLSLIVQCILIVRGRGEHEAILAGYLLVACAPAFLAAVYGALRMRVASREAAAVLTLDYGAISSDLPGEPFRCRNCGAPLPRLTDPLLVRCMYCQADNLLDLDLGARREQQASDAHGLLGVLARRRAERSRWLKRTAVAAAGFVVLATATWFTSQAP